MCVCVCAASGRRHRRLNSTRTHTPPTTTRHHPHYYSDFCYADTTSADGVSVAPQPELPTSSFHPLWDYWGRLFEPLLSRGPFLHTPGNHVRFSC